MLNRHPPFGWRGVRLQALRAILQVIPASVPRVTRRAGLEEPRRAVAKPGVALFGSASDVPVRPPATRLPQSLLAGC